MGNAFLDLHSGQNQNVVKRIAGSKPLIPAAGIEGRRLESEQMSFKPSEIAA